MAVRLLGLEQQDSAVAEVEIDEMLSLCDQGSSADCVRLPRVVWGCLGSESAVPPT